MLLSDLEATRLNKVLTSVNLTLAEAELKHPDLEYGPMMARLIAQRDAAAFAARKGDTVSPNQRNSLEAHLALATHRGDTVLAGKLDALLVDFDATYARASQALDICTRVQGKPASEFYPTREGSSAGSTSTSPANAVDVSGILAEEAV